MMQAETTDKTMLWWKKVAQLSVTRESYLEKTERGKNAMGMM